MDANSLILLVARAGIEPARCKHRGILSAKSGKWGAIRKPLSFLAILCKQKIPPSSHVLVGVGEKWSHSKRPGHKTGTMGTP